MPHLRLEYSTNVKEKIHPAELFAPCHRILVETVNAEVSRCQSRAIACNQFHVGEGTSKEAFVSLEVMLLGGRSSEQLEEMGKQLLKFLERYFAQSMKELKMQISVRSTEISKSYKKITTDQ